MFKSIFFIYILFKCHVAQASSNEIHVHYNDQFISFKRTWLNDGEVFTVDDLIDSIKLKLKNTIEKVSDKVITLHRGENEVLDSTTSISGLYNTKDEALHVVVGKHNINCIYCNSFCDFY